jgi:phenylacetate-CoA ligase
MRGEAGMTRRPDLQSFIQPLEPGGMGAEIVNVQRFLHEAQWWPPDQLRALQWQKLSALATHAAASVPFYAERLRQAGFVPGSPMDEATWSRLPILTREDLRDQGENLCPANLPEGFGPQTMASSSGSTGIPVRVRKSAIDQLVWNASYVREEFWHCDDIDGTYAVIKAFSGVNFPPEAAAAVASPTGLLLPDWGPPANLVWNTGRIGLIHSNVPIAAKAAFLIRLQPQYLLTSPSTLRLLLAFFRDHGLELRSLLSVRTMSERLDDELRELCQAVFKCRVVHNYTANEVGYIAMQCPETTAFHVQAEMMLCEVLDPDGRPCAPGEIGRVVVTPLHNFAMPLLRYEIGDEAMVGEPCQCGRGLPVLRSVVGRLSEYLTLRDGQRRRVTYNTYRLSSVTAILEYQLAQTGLEEIELRLVVSRALTDEEAVIAMDVMTKAFGDAFTVTLRYCDALERTAAGKLRPFVSEIPAAS